MRNRLAGTGLLAIAFCQPVLAEDQAPTELEQVVVTDGLTSVELEKSGRAVTVVTGEQMEKNRVRYVSDALRLVPGLAVSRAGSVGGLTQVRMRGAESDQVLVVIDGVEASNHTRGEFDFGGLVAEDIERIEILRGPQSTFWGANAMAGVISITTRKGERGSRKSTAQTEVGSDGTLMGALATRGGGENFDYALSGSMRRSRGFDISDLGAEDDGARNSTFNGRFSADISPETTVDGTLRLVDRRTDLDEQDFMTAETYDVNDYQDDRELYGSIGIANTALDGALTQKARLAASDMRSFNHSALFGDSSSEGNRYNAAYQASYRYEDLENQVHQLTAGYEWQRETYAPSQYTTTFSRNTHAAIGEYRGEFFDQLFINGGLRQDWNDTFADATTWTASAAWQVPEMETRLHASVGTGVTNPTFTEQYGFFPGSFVGNPNLKPEESFGWDIGVEKRFFDGGLVIDVTYFNQNLENEISSTQISPGLYRPINMGGESLRQGVEVSATVDFFNGLTATASYTYTDASEQEVAGGARLAETRRPRHSGSLNAAYAFYDDRARVFVEALFNGAAEDRVFASTLPPRVTLGGYTLVNVGGSFKVNETVEAYGRIDNLFDRDYREVFGFNTPGLTAFAGLKATF
ncbi:TonB-dependent receptor plug domain-containing protein [Shinella zoogloeoides]|uniref:TonB-dependent receptor n=1 Tax=Shinella zoogloeoides TaxID=352475 RepID=A0A6N8TCY2_SHIZO|nr:TonB-dependent receptor [Shinella zoogloeoides]MXO01123.1 TonB-dependent receptor [Shinella zoogloeoides]UEX84341.1 TonB-dependent receptor [Shinella zoogloeoides]